ncbi:MAG: ATP-binding cassette domain-containing protein [Longimicrobiales bacterium]|nr:ATP-binding cassette domain-containing protein [Longimicrobiales bacterium]
MVGKKKGVLELDFRVGFGAGEMKVRLETESSAVAVFGPSGGGKSTLLRTLAGVERRASGVVRVRGQYWLDTQEGVFVSPWERRVGWVPQDYLLFPHLKVRENLNFAGATVQEVGEVAELLMVDHLLDRRPRRLSGGEQQRVALGRALLSNPGILLLDEPFSALDRPLRNHVASRLRDFVRTKELLMLLVSHDEADAVALAHEHWLLSDGRLERVE